MTQYDDVYSDHGRGGPLQEQYEANRKLLADYQKDCTHPSEHVTADILEGDRPGMRVKWCRLCGAVRQQYLTDKKSGWHWQETGWRVPCAVPDNG